MFKGVYIVTISIVTMPCILFHLYESVRDGIIHLRSGKINPDPDHESEPVHTEEKPDGFQPGLMTPGISMTKKSLSLCNENSGRVAPIVSLVDTIRCMIHNRLFPSCEIIFSKNLARHNEIVPCRKVRTV